MDQALQPASDDACEVEVIICNREGLHARPAAQFVRLAAKYPNVELSVSKEDMCVNGKSIIGIMMLAAGPGSKLFIKAHGEGARSLLSDLQSLVDARFGEEAFQ